MKRRVGWSVALAGLTLAAVAVCGPAWAQSAGAGGASGASGVEWSERYGQEPALLRRAVAERIARIPLLRLRSATAPEPLEFRLAALALEMALSLDPGNEAMVRLQIEAWNGARDTEEMMRATRRLISLDPTDTVAMLRLVSGRIGERQDVGSRLEAYDTTLGAPGDTLNAAIKSRLALDAALLARENGDDAGFTKYLTRAVQLDQSNKDAAVLAASWYLERSEDPVGRVEMLVAVLLSDPLDANAHLNLARELRSHGAFMAAQRFQDTAGNLLQALGVAPSLQQQIEALTGIWQAAGSEVLLRGISEIEANARQQRIQQIEMARMQGRDVGPPLEETRLPPDYEILRLVVNMAQGRDSGAATSMHNIALETQKILAALENPSTPGAPQLSASDRERALRYSRIETTWLRLWSGHQIDEAAAALDTMEADRLLNDTALARYRGWLALRRGDLETARSLLEPEADNDPRSALGLAAIGEAEDDLDEAARWYGVVSSRQAGTLLGAYARRRLETITGEPAPTTPLARRLEEYIGSIPAWVDAMTRDPRSFMFLSVEPVNARTSPLDGQRLRVTLRNVGRLPLAVGPGRALESRVLLTPQLQVDQEVTGDQQQSELVDMGRRLRLLPGEEIVAEVWGGQGRLGALLDGLAAKSLTVRWRGIQGFRIAQNGAYLPGLMCLTADSPLITQSGVTPLGYGAQGMAAGFDNVQGDALYDAIMYARSAMVTARADMNNPEARPTITAMGNAVADRMTDMSELERAFTVLVIGSTYARAEESPIDAAVSGDTSDLMLAVRLIAKVPDAADPLFDAAIASENRALSEFASALRERLQRPDVAGAAR